jgi:hypothetical protein
MASLSKLMLTLEQNEEHKKLRVVRVGYGYQLKCSPVDLRERLVYTVCVDVLGDELISDNKLALDIDTHEVLCECDIPGEDQIGIQREFMVAQSVLDEDIGIDEIKLNVRAVASTGESCEGMTGIIRGRF